MTPKKNVGHSIRQRLLNYAKSSGQDFNQVLLRFANERLLYRLGKSEYVDRFLLKGATLFLVWNESKPHRPTRDVDLLGFGPEDAAELRKVFGRLCSMAEEDGIEYDGGTIEVKAIREDQRYGGLRLELKGKLHGARVHLQIDVGYGDVVTPEAEEIEVPGILKELEAPRLKGYPVYTVIAEKLEAMVQLGMTNSRMKDFYDVDFLLGKFELEEGVLREAVRRTFERRGTALPEGEPQVFQPEFQEQKEVLWRQFLERNELNGTDLELGKVLQRLRGRLLATLGGRGAGFGGGMGAAGP